MADTGRTTEQYLRIYQNGRDLSGEAYQVGDLDWSFDRAKAAAFNWAVQSGLLGMPTIQTGPINSILRIETATADSPYSWIKDWDRANVVQTIPLGIRGVPQLGNPVWVATQVQTRSFLARNNGFVTLNIQTAPSLYDADGNALNYGIPWGTLLHASAARTAVNSSTGHDGGAETTAGGYMCAQILACAGAGNVTIKVQDAAVNADGSFADVAGLTTGLVANTAIPKAVIAQAATAATIRQFTRWQIVLAGITSVTFVLALVRGRA